VEASCSCPRALVPRAKRQGQWKRRPSFSPDELSARQRAEEEKEETIAEMVRLARAGLGAEGEAGTPVFDKEWKDLIAAEKSAARNLNFKEESWNADNW
jgi:hypothetical protein